MPPAEPLSKPEATFNVLPPVAQQAAMIVEPPAVELPAAPSPPAEAAAAPPAAPSAAPAVAAPPAAVRTEPPAALPTAASIESPPAAAPLAPPLTVKVEPPGPSIDEIRAAYQREQAAALGPPRHGARPGPVAPRYGTRSTAPPPTPKPAPVEQPLFDAPRPLLPQAPARGAPRERAMPAARGGRSSKRDAYAAQRVGSSAVTFLGERDLARKANARFPAEPRPRAYWHPETKDACEVCGGAYTDCLEDTIVYCDGCDRGFHQQCYHVTVIPEDDWFCRVCIRRRGGVTPLTMIPQAPHPPTIVEHDESGDPDLILDALKHAGLDKCMDFLVLASVQQRFGYPSLPLRSLIDSLRTDLARVQEYEKDGPCAYEKLCKNYLRNTGMLPKKEPRWCTALADCLRIMHCVEMSSWLIDQDELEACRPVGKPPTESTDEFQVGDTVEAQWKGRAEWWEGTVDSISELTIGVKYDDGSIEPVVPVGLCRPGAALRTKNKEYKEAMEAGIHAKLEQLTAKRRVAILRKLAEETLQGGVVKQRLEKATGQSRDWYPRQFIDEAVIGVDSQGRSYRCMEDDAGGCLLYRERDPGRTPPHGPHCQERARKRPKLAAPSRRDARSNQSCEAIACSPRQIQTIANDMIGGHDGDELWLAKSLRDLAKHVAAKREDRATVLKQQERAIRRERQVARDLGQFALPESTSRTRNKKVDYSDMGNG